MHFPSACFFSVWECIAAAVNRSAIGHSARAPLAITTNARSCVLLAFFLLYNGFSGVSSLIDELSIRAAQWPDLKNLLEQERLRRNIGMDAIF